MHIICIGYGRLGTQVVRVLDTQKHKVVVIDKERSALERRDRDLHAKFLFGNAIDEDLLREAGAEHADALFALTRDENTNLMAAQVARIVFNIPRIIAVVYDPAREETYRAAGIETLPITVAGAEYLVRRLEEMPDQKTSLKEAWERAQGHAAAAPLPTPAPGARPPDQPFYVVVLGGGRVGYFLTRALRANNIEVTIIEASQKIYDLVTRQVDCPVILGDGSATAIQEQAGVSRANVFVAVTNHDHDNLIACQIAKQRFGVPKTIARVKNPHHPPLRAPPQPHAHRAQPAHRRAGADGVPPRLRLPRGRQDSARAEDSRRLQPHHRDAPGRKHHPPRRHRAREGRHRVRPRQAPRRARPEIGR